MSDIKKNLAETSRYLNFSLGKEEFIIPLLAVQEVIAIPAVTPIPEAPAYFLGIMNLRGRIISVVNLSLKLKAKEVGERSAETAVIILDLGGSLSVGVIVDSVNSVLAVSHDHISPCPELGDGTKAPCLEGVARANDKMYLMLDVKKLFLSDEDQLRLSAQQSAPEALAQPA